MLRLYSTLAKNKPAATQPFGLSLNLLYFYHRGILAGDVIGRDETQAELTRRSRRSRVSTVSSKLKPSTIATT